MTHWTSITSLLLLFSMAFCGLGFADGIEGGIRLRYESRSPWASTGGSDKGFFSRVTLHDELTIIEGVTLEGELEFARLFGDENGSFVPAAQQGLGFHTLNFFVEDLGVMHDQSVLDGMSLRVGRQDVPTYGKGRVIATSAWDYHPRVWDGFHVNSAFEAGVLDFHYVDLDNTLVRGGGHQPIPNGSGNGAILWGMNVGLNSLPIVESEFYFWNDRSSGAGESTTTAGVRFVTREDERLYPYLDLEFEYALQRGRRGTGTPGVDASVDAGLIAVDGSYVVTGSDVNLLLGFGYSRSTGTSAGATSDEDFIPPMGSPHGLHGIADLVTDTNLEDIYFRADFVPMAGVSAHAAFHLLGRDKDPAGVGEYGNEFDLWAQWPLDERIDLEAGLSRFNAEASDLVDKDFIYFQVSMPLGS